MMTDGLLRRLSDYRKLFYLIEQHLDVYNSHLQAGDDSYIPTLEQIGNEIETTVHNINDNSDGF